LITKEYFEQFWERNYGDTPPVGHILRHRFFNDRWFRIHNLPDSKRYADNSNELKILLDRQNTLITDLIGEGSDYLLLFYRISGKPMTLDFLEIPNAVYLDSIRLDAVLPEDFEDESYLSMAFVNKTWKAGSIDGYLAQVANEGRVIDINGLDNSYALLIINIARNRILSPYDGGVDIFLNEESERDLLKSKFTDWLSRTASGL